MGNIPVGVSAVQSGVPASESARRRCDSPIRLPRQTPPCDRARVVDRGLPESRGDDEFLPRAVARRGRLVSGNLREDAGRPMDAFPRSGPASESRHQLALP